MLSATFEIYVLNEGMAARLFNVKNYDVQCLIQAHFNKNIQVFEINMVWFGLVWTLLVLSSVKVNLSYVSQGVKMN